MKRSLLTLFVFCSLFCDAQKQGNMWFFGDHAGLDFSSGSPVFVSGQTVGMCEGTASLCDSSGALLFYTDGTQLWNGNQQPMPNGDSLLGHWSSSQSAIIIPLPGSSRFFYVFTTD